MRTRAEGRVDWAVGLAVGLALLLAYTPRIAPGLLGGDAGEFQMAAWLAGLAHPTGYPLYLLLGWLWTHGMARFGLEPATAMNWLSALFGAGVGVLAVPVGVAIQGRVNQGVSSTSRSRARSAVAALLALGFAWSTTFRAQALMAEVYTLHLFFMVLLLWLLLARARLPWFGLVYGLSLAHHRTSLLWAPAFFVFLWLDRRVELRNPRVVTRTLLLLLLPQLLYLYVPLRGPRTPYLHQTLAPAETLVLYDGSARAFWEHVTGTVFRAQLGAVGPPAERLRLVGRLAAAQLDWARTAEFGLVGAQPVAVALGALGLAGAAWLIWRGSWATLALLGLGALATAAFGLAYGIGDVEVMFLPLWLVAALLPQPLLGAMAARSRLMAGAAATLLLLLLAGLPLSAWLDRALLASHTSPIRASWERLLAARPPQDAILVSNDRNEILPLWYLQFVEGRRGDLLGLFPLITPRPEHADVGAVVSFALATGRPVRLIKPMPGLDLRFDLAAGEGDLVAVEGVAIVPDRPPSEAGPAPELAVTGWELGPDEAVVGQRLTVTLAWQVYAPLPAELTTYVHLVDGAGGMVAQSDHQAGGVFYPSQLWPQGVSLRDRHLLELPATLAPGSYELRAGAYRFEGGALLPLGRELLLGQLTVGPASARRPDQVPVSK